MSQLFSFGLCILLAKVHFARLPFLASDFSFVCDALTVLTMVGYLIVCLYFMYKRG